MSGGVLLTPTRWPCNKAHGAKVMAWVGIVDGQVLPVHWFQGSVDGLTWQSRATRRHFWFQQDSASPHCTDCTFLASKIGDRVISRRTEHHWPPYSPDLNPLDFSFWSQAMAHAVRCEPKLAEGPSSVSSRLVVISSTC